ncbi:hypothetical protein BD560DRAFT_442787 [Blakeslea trispora]|nr:hypothetical protein BD560DRAFT_442787 [Blakeslea trispora]
MALTPLNTSNFLEDSDSNEDGFSPKRCSTSSSSSSVITSHSHPSSLEKKVQALEQQLEQHIKKEISLESQLMILQQQLSEKQKRNQPLCRISKRINSFLSHKQEKVNEAVLPLKREGYQNVLFDEANKDDHILHSLFSAQPLPSTGSSPEPSNLPTTVFLHRLKSMIQEFNKTSVSHPALVDLGIDLQCLMDAWQTQYDQAMAKYKQKRLKDQETITQLLRALHRSLLKNRMLEKDTKWLMKRIRQTTRQSIHHYPALSNKKKNKSTPQQEIEALELHVTQLTTMLTHSQEEKEEYETTLEMMRREMEGMLEELEDVRQQRTRYKQQTARLRESVQKILPLQPDEALSDQDREKEAIQLLYREAERQTNDLDRECKRQSLALVSLRNELKSTEQRYQSIKLEKNKRLIQLELLNQTLTRQIQQLERQSDPEMQAAKDHAYQLALETAATEASLLRTRIYQLEQQDAVTKNLFQDINRIEFVFLSSSQPSKQTVNYLELADRIEIEQRQWKQENRKLLKRQHDIDALRMHRELRELASQMSELEYETERLRETHQEELTRYRHQANAHLEKQLQQASLEQKMKEQALRDQLEVLFHQNQTLQQESLVLYVNYNMSSNTIKDDPPPLSVDTVMIDTRASIGSSSELSPYLLTSCNEDLHAEQTYHAVQIVSKNYCFAHNTYHVMSWCPICEFKI